MFSVPPPRYSSEVSYAKCVGGVMDHGLQARLEAASPTVASSDAAYRAAAAICDFGTLGVVDFVMPGVSDEEMSNLYARKMVAKRSPGRVIYDVIRMASAGGKCPSCGHRDVTTLDHYLPKARYPALAVNPCNLVPACSDCNKLKAALVDETLHPYYDFVDDVQWLRARVLENTPVAIDFEVVPSDEWPPSFAKRVASHFDLMGLKQLYAAQAARHLSGIRRLLGELHETHGAAGVQTYLTQAARSWCTGTGLNSWETALYEALASDGWFCAGGFGF